MKLSADQVKRLKIQLEEAAGAAICSGLLAAETEDLALNPDGYLWEKTRSGGWKAIAQLNEYEAYSIVNTVASIRQKELSDRSPFLETSFPLDGSRFSAIVPPVVRFPVFSLRIKRRNDLRPADFERAGVLTECDDPMNVPLVSPTFVEEMKGKRHLEVLLKAIELRLNILVVGPTGSGKTFLYDSVLTEIGYLFPAERVVTIEDTDELSCNLSNAVDLLATDGVSMLDCLRAAMRLRPKRIVVGEVRGPEAHAMLKAWNTGHPGGGATIHANSAYEGLVRLESLVAESTQQPQQALIAQAVNLVIFMSEESRLPVGRKVREMLAVTGYDRNKGRYQIAKL